MTHEDFKKLHLRIFSTADGQLLLDHWKKLYAHGHLFDDSEKLTYYRIGKRDFVLEIMDYLEDTKHE